MGLRMRSRSEALFQSNGGLCRILLSLPGLPLSCRLALIRRSGVGDTNTPLHCSGSHV
jgi:hypothetical protein